MVALIDVGGSELLLILGAALVLLGPRRLPEIARQIGQINNKLRDANRELKRELYSNLDPPPPLPAPPSAPPDPPGLIERAEPVARRREPAGGAEVDYEAPYRDAEAELARERSAGPAREGATGDAALADAEAGGESAADPAATTTKADPDVAGSASSESGPRGT